MILVVGANGFLGSELSESLSKNKINFIKIDKTLSGKEKIDINKKNELELIFKHNKIDTIINCACEPATSKSKKKIWETNVFANKNFLEFSEKYSVKKYIFISTSAIWVKDYQFFVDELTPTNPVEIYGKSKVKAEEDIESSTLKNWTIFRVPMIVSERRLGVLSILFDFIIDNKKIPLIGNGSNKLQFIHIDDLIEFIIKSLNISEKEKYNLASDEILTLKELIDKLILSIESKSKIILFKDLGYLFLLSILNKINLSPLNVYHLKMLKYSLTMDTNKIKKNYNLSPKINTSSMMIDALIAYKNKKYLSGSKTEITAPVKMGILKVISFFL
tara:strand:- start:368 stop:1363 length:996 start_codon:yes stop_codon:yes gene_type:complete